MANNNEKAAAKLKELKLEADELGITYQDDVTEDNLREALRNYREATKPVAKATTPAPAMDLAVLGDAIGKAIGKANAKADTSDPYKSVQMEEIDPNDLVEPETYYAPMLFWIAPAYKVAGQRVMAPIEKVVFTLDRGSSVQVGTQFQTRYISTYTTNNRRQQAWLKTNPFYKKSFFLSGGDTSNLSSKEVRHAMSFGKHLDALNYTMSTELYRLAAEMGISLDHGASLAVQRTQVAQELATRDIIEQDRRNEEIKEAASRISLLTTPR